MFDGTPIRMHKRRQFQFPYSERDHGEINCWNSLLPAAERNKERERVREREREREDAQS